MLTIKTLEKIFTLQPNGTNIIQDGNWMIILNDGDEAIKWNNQGEFEIWVLPDEIEYLLNGLGI